MALPSAIKLFINPRTGLAFGNFNGTSQITNPTVTLGDTARFEIYLVEDTGINSYPRQEVAFPGTPGIKIAVGPIDESPQAGTWKVSFGGDITAALAYNITAAALATALNGLASITAAGGVSVSKIGDNYNIAFNQNGARGDILTDGAALIPLSNATVAKLQVGDSTRPQIALIHLQRTIAGLATSFTATAASAITIESLSAWDGSRATYRASISPDPKGGSFSLAFDAATGTDVSSASIAIGASAIDVQNALNLGALVDKVSVSQVGAYAYDITVTAQPGTGGLTASGAGLISFSGYVGELSLNTAEAISLLDGADFVATNLEVEITSDSKTLTVLQIPCTLKNAVIDAGSVQPLILDSYLTQALADGRYARQANNLSDLASVSQARTNLGVYSTSSVDTALALKANLSGATFSGEIATPTLGNLLNTDLVIDSYNDTGAGTHYLHKFTPYDGKFVLAANGGGITFPDGTTQATAFAGSVTWGSISGSLSSQSDLTTALGLKANLVAPTLSGGVVINRNPSGTTLKLVDPTSINFGTDFNNTSIIIRAGDVSEYCRMDSQAFSLYSGANTAGFSIGGFVINGAEPYARKSGATFTGSISAKDGVSVITNSQSSAGISVNVANADIGFYIFDNVSNVNTYIAGGLFLNQSGNNLIEPYARKDGATFTGKVNTVAPTSTNAGINIGSINSTANLTNSAAGDVWIGTWQMAYKTANGTLVYGAGTNATNVFGSPQIIDTTATTPGLRVTQKGTGAALLVEDQTTPDTSALVVDAAGNVGIGVAVGYTATDKVEVVGNLKADNFKNGSGPTYRVVSIDSHTGGSDTHDLLISVGGSTYRVGMRFVSTP